MFTSAVFCFLKAGQKPAECKGTQHSSEQCEEAKKVNHHVNYLTLNSSKIILTTLFFFILF
jgi:hypothetical protein